jgi:hypothetical protein
VKPLEAKKRIPSHIFMGGDDGRRRHNNVQFLARRQEED